MKCDTFQWHFLSLSLLVIGNAYGIRFTLQPNTHKCFMDEVQAHQLVVLDIERSDAPSQRIDYVVSGFGSADSIQLLADRNVCLFQVRDSKGGILAQKEGIASTAKSTFTSEILDTYEVCITSHVPPGTEKR